MVLTLGVLKNHEILIQAQGSDAETAVHDLTNLVQNNFGEAEN